MRNYVVRRVLLAPLTLLLVFTMVFGAMRLLPGDPALRILMGRGEGMAITDKAQYEALRERLGLNVPLHQQYGEWVVRAVRLDFGTSLATDRSIAEEVQRRLPVTFELAIMAWVFSWLIGVPLGAVMAVRQDSWPDYVLRVLTLTGITMPTFWTGSLILLFLVRVFHWIPSLEAVLPWEDPWQSVQQVIFPALVLGFFYGALLARMTRSSLLEVLRQDYVRTAWSKGLRAPTVYGRHASRNALIPIVTVSGIHFAHMLGGALILEFLFAIPGMGSALVNAVNDQDFPMVQALVVLIAVWYLLTNLAVDVSYGIIDPRIRYK